LLTTRLQKLGIGCHIGNIFCGAFGYADDVILLAPTRKTLRLLLDECVSFATEYSLLFNARKSKYLIFNSSTAECNGSMTFGGNKLDNVESDVHLGNIIGNNTNRARISKATSDFYRRFNVLQTGFRHANVGTKYVLFKTHCMPLYGCQLWDYSSKDCELFYTAWRKCVRSMFGLDVRTHNQLLHYICGDIGIEGQLHRRFLKFIHGALNSTNTYTYLCARLAMNGSDSGVSKSLTFVANKYKLIKYQLPIKSMANLLSQVKGEQDNNHLATSGAILDFIWLRDSSMVGSEERAFVQDIINNLGTS
jgi:hypothetical protein